MVSLTDARCGTCCSLKNDPDFKRWERRQRWKRFYGRHRPTLLGAGTAAGCLLLLALLAGLLRGLHSPAAVQPGPHAAAQPAAAQPAPHAHTEAQAAGAKLQQQVYDGSTSSGTSSGGGSGGGSGSSTLEQQLRRQLAEVQQDLAAARVAAQELTHVKAAAEYQSNAAIAARAKLAAAEERLAQLQEQQSGAAAGAAGAKPGADAVAAGEEVASLKAVLSAREAELGEWRQKADAAMATAQRHEADVAQRQAAGVERAAADFAEQAARATEEHRAQSSRLETEAAALRASLQAERQQRQMLEGRATAAEQLAAAVQAQQAREYAAATGKASGGDKGSFGGAFGSGFQAAANAFMSPAWALRRLAAQGRAASRHLHSLPLGLRLAEALAAALAAYALLFWVPWQLLTGEAEVRAAHTAFLPVLAA